MFKIKTEYTDGTTQQDSWGAERAITPGLLVAGIDLNPEHKKSVKDFFLQSADYPGMITIDKVIACTKAEYEQMLKEEKAKRFDLTLKKVNEGGGADYDPATKTISIKDDIRDGTLTTNLGISASSTCSSFSLPNQRQPKVK